MTRDQASKILLSAIKNDSAPISVFTKDDNDTVRHSYTAQPRMAPEIKERGIDLITPVWNLLDLVPQGRGEWYPSHAYGSNART
jgi:predicted dithiol-disulfide oxidoreductase (DUF899 family)